MTFHTVSENFMFLMVTKYWETWSVSNRAVGGIPHHLGSRVGGHG
jgi:hypothetical protein